MTFVNGRLKCLLLLLLLLFGYSDLPASRLNMPRSTSYRLMALNGHVSWTRREFSTSSSWTLSLVTCSRHAPLDLREADGIKYTSNASVQKERVHAVNVYFSFAKVRTFLYRQTGVAQLSALITTRNSADPDKPTRRV